jgi:hypothetical protein
MREGRLGRQGNCGRGMEMEDGKRKMKKVEREEVDGEWIKRMEV